MVATNEEAQWGKPVETSADRWMVELWCEDGARKAWLLYGQTAEDRAALVEAVAPAPLEVSEPTRNERGALFMEDTLIRGRVVSLDAYRAVVAEAA